MICESFPGVGGRATGFDFSNLFNFVRKILEVARLPFSAFVEANPENEVQVLYQGEIVSGESDIGAFGGNIWEVEAG